MPDKIVRMNLTEEHVRQSAHHYRVNGCLILENSFDPEKVRAMQANFMERYVTRDRAEVEKNCLKVGEERYMFSVELTPPWLDPAVYASPDVLPIVKELLGQDCILQSFGVVCAYPGAPAQHVHRDHEPLFAEAGGLNAFFPPYALHVVIPLIDLDENTGTTALWEGSHRIKTAREEHRYSQEQLERFEGAVLPRSRIGDCYFMDYRLRHVGTANRSGGPRPILYLVYSRRWFLDRRNFDLQSPMAISPADYDSIPEEYRSLFITAQPRG